MIYIYITYFFYLLIFTTLLKKVYTNRNSKALSILCIFLFAIINVNLKMYSFDHLRMYNIDHINTCCSRR